MPTAGQQPTGTVTFLFSDIEGSTQLVRRFGNDWPGLLERHRTLLRAAFAEHGGWEDGTEGDSFFVVFASAPEAVAAAVAGQRALDGAEWPADGRIRVRMGLHTGEGRISGDSYVGIDVHRAARIAAAAHGGQVIVSESTAALIAPALPSGVALLDLGSHRLKDLPVPEHLRQLVIDGLQSAFPPLRSLGGRATNLPVALSSLVGREADVAAVRDLVRSTRLVTVTGPGGTGKTRLVQEVARSMASALDGGATFVPLEALRDADLIPTEILRSLRLDTAAGASPRDRVVAALSERPSLIVLDNLEQLTGAAAVVRDLLASIDGLRVLASSQAALHVSGEQEYALQPLPDGEAVRLFVERAQAVRPDFVLDAAGVATVTAICERLDGLPLAIELAAAQVRLLAPTAILARLTDRIGALAARQADLPQRQRTLRATVSWSYDLLGSAEQRLFRRLSVFVGGATLADIEAFEGPRGDDALETLDSLVDRSLVVVRRLSAEEHRFAMLDTVRAVARDLLAEAGEDRAALDDHSRVFRDIAAAAEPELYGRNRRTWLDRLSAEHDNLRAALDHLLASGDLASALDVASNLWRFWQTRGHLLEATARLAELLAIAADRTDLDPGLMSRAEEAAGGIAYWMRTTQGEQVEPHYERSLEWAKRAGDRAREAWALYNMAFVYDFVAMTVHPERVDPAHAIRLRSEALETFRAIGDKRGIGESLWALGGNAVVMQSDPDGARRHLAEASAVLSEIGNSYGAAWSFMSLGMLESMQDHLEAARANFLNAAELFLADDDFAGMTIVLEGLGALAARSGDDRLAIRLEAVALSLAHDVGVDPPLINVIVEPLQEARARLSADQAADEVGAASTIEARAFIEAALAQRAAAGAGASAAQPRG
ncbi:MAG TPA: adenylate/guanylate cyclase domain-containing protein [Candidatus Limnocylindrales bacterium]